MNKEKMKRIDRSVANELCFNCKKATDGIACPWASKNPKPPRGAIYTPVYEESTGELYTFKILRCPDFYSDDAKEPMTKEEYVDSIMELIPNIYDNLSNLRRVEAAKSRKLTQLLRVVGKQRDEAQKVIDTFDKRVTEIGIMNDMIESFETKELQDAATESVIRAKKELEFMEPEYRRAQEFIKAIEPFSSDITNICKHMEEEKRRGGRMMDEIYEELPEIEDSTWHITDDSTADWAVQKVKEEIKERDRLTAICDERISYFNGKKAEIAERSENKTAFLISRLEEYFATVTPSETKTQKKYKLVSGDLVQTKSKMELKQDKEALADWLNVNGYDVFLKKEAKWGDLKKHLSYDEKTGIITMDTGEIVDKGVTAEPTEPKFSVK